MSSTTNHKRGRKASKREREMSRIPGSPSRRFWIYLIPGLLMLLWIIVIPAVWNIYLSFTNYRGIKPPVWAGLTNWARLVKDHTFWVSFMNSIWMILAMVIIPILVGLVLSSLLFDVVQKKFGPRTASTMRALYYFPQLLPIAVASLVMGWILRPENGALNALLKAIGLGDLQHDWLGKPDTALIFLMLIMIWIQIGYPLVIFMSGLQRVDPELYEAASLDGANSWQKFWHITIPALRPTFNYIVIFGLIGAFQVFDQVFILTSGGPDRATETIVYRIYTEAFGNGKLGYASALSYVLLIMTLIVGLIQLYTNAKHEKEELA